MLFDMDVHIAISDMPVLEKVMYGIKRTQGASKKPQPKLPITPAILQQLLSTIPQGQDIHKQIFRTAFTIATFGMLRCGEFTSTDTYSQLRIRHIKLITEPQAQTPSRMQIYLPASKTEVFRHGVTVTLPCICEQSPTCPIHETVDMLSLYAKHNMPTKPEDPLFKFPDGRILSRADVGSMLSALCTAAKLPAHLYSGHSFRKGGATALAKHGAPDWMIQTLGRWKSSSYKRYINTPPDIICQYVQAMLP